jgi:hypothetical protein
MYAEPPLYSIVLCDTIVVANNMQRDNEAKSKSSIQAREINAQSIVVQDAIVMFHRPVIGVNSPTT